ncbi:DUF6193 family natural product biosynthesis protein [Nonomuraea sp. NPDC050383]|uniref:DUF6193 family natural product biosynthesis protein n=1 Tax=Nonomuraea sp. NPDC050383 TaxID=3364362 RepID=UPI0037A01D09
MTDGMDFPAADPSEYLDAELYPDLTQLGGLASAIRQLARDNCIELEKVDAEPGAARYITAKIPLSRGRISVLLGAERRWFSVTIEGNAHVWASGGTNDLLAVVEMADSWRQGVTLRGLADRFPFMSYSRLSEAYESGDPVSVQWDHLLGDAAFRQQANVLQAVHRADRLRMLFPYVSHGTIRLALDHLERRAGEIWIAPLADGRFRVESTNSRDSRREVGSVEDAIEIALSYLPG